jgi:hypothetical protein
MRMKKLILGILCVGLVGVFFATGCSCSKEENKGPDYLQMTKDADQTIIDGTAISDKTVRKSTQDAYDKNILNVTEDKSHLERYKGQDSDGDGMDDYEFIVSHANVGLGLLKMVDLLDMLLGLLSNLSVEEPAIKPLATLTPGSSCGSSIGIGSYLSVVESILPQFLDPIVNSFENAISVDSGKKYNLVLSDNAKLVIGSGTGAITLNLAGEWDSGDILLLSAGFNGIYGAISSLLAFNTTSGNPTVDGLLNMLITECYGKPWVRSDVGPDFLKINNPTKLQQAKPKLSNAIGEVKDALAFINAETDTQDDDIIKYIDTDGDGKKELHIKLLESIPDAASIASGLADLSEGINLTALSDLLGAIKTNIDNGSSAKVDLAKYVTPLLPQNNNSDSTDDISESEMQQKVGLLLDLSPLFNATPGTDYKDVLPLWVNGEHFTDNDPDGSGPQEPNNVFDLSEPFSDENGSGAWNAPECYDDQDGNGSYTTGESFTDTVDCSSISGFDGRDTTGTIKCGVALNNEFDDIGDFYMISEMEKWEDLDDSTGKGALCNDPNYSDTFGYDSNDSFIDGSYGFAADSVFSKLDSDHPWPDGSGTDPQNCIEDVVYLFFPDPTFKGILSKGTNLSLTDGGSCTYTPSTLDNAALNGIINNIYYILGPELSGLL